jgi:hypothetical protein
MTRTSCLGSRLACRLVDFEKQLAFEEDGWRHVGQWLENDNGASGLPVVGVPSVADLEEIICERSRE